MNKYFFLFFVLSCSLLNSGCGKKDSEEKKASYVNSDGSCNDQVYDSVNGFLTRIENFSIYTLPQSDSFERLWPELDSLIKECEREIGKFSGPSCRVRYKDGRESLMKVDEDVFIPHYVKLKRLSLNIKKYPKICPTDLVRRIAELQKSGDYYEEGLLTYGRALEAEDSFMNLETRTLKQEEIKGTYQRIQDKFLGLKKDYPANRCLIIPEKINEGNYLDNYPFISEFYQNKISSYLKITQSLMDDLFQKATPYFLQDEMKFVNSIPTFQRTNSSSVHSMSQNADSHFVYFNIISNTEKLFIYLPVLDQGNVKLKVYKINPENKVAELIDESQVVQNFALIELVHITQGRYLIKIESQSSTPEKNLHIYERFNAHVR